MTIQMPFQNRVHRSSPNRFSACNERIIRMCPNAHASRRAQPHPHMHHKPSRLSTAHARMDGDWCTRGCTTCGGLAAAMKSTPEIGPGRLKETLEDDCSSLFDKKAAASKYFFYVGFGRGIVRNLCAVARADAKLYPCGLHLECSSNR